MNTSINNENNYDNIMKYANSVDLNNLNGTNIMDLNKINSINKNNNYNNNFNNNQSIETITKELINNLNKNYNNNENNNLNNNIPMNNNLMNENLDDEIIDIINDDKIIKKSKKQKKHTDKTIKSQNFIDTINEYINIKDFCLLFAIYFLLSQDMIKDMFSTYFTSLNSDENGQIHIRGVIIYGLILTIIYTILHKMI